MSISDCAGKSANFMIPSLDRFSQKYKRPQNSAALSLHPVVRWLRSSPAWTHRAGCATVSEQVEGPEFHATHCGLCLGNYPAQLSGFGSYEGLPHHRGSATMECGAFATNRRPCRCGTNEFG